MIAGFKPNARKLTSRPHELAVIAFDGIVLGDLAMPLEVFGRARDAGDHAAYEVRVCSHQLRVCCEHLTLEPPHRLSWLVRARTIIVPGVADIERAVPAEILKALRAAIARGTRVASICTGALVLAQTGVLDGRRATTHWRCASELARRYPAIEVDPNVLYVDEGNVLTSAGAAAGLDLCLHIVRNDLGAEAAARVAKDAVMPLERAGGQAQFIEHAPPSGANGTVGVLLCWLEENLNKVLTLAAIARRAGMSTRTLSRRFGEQVGMTPAQWIARARIRRAQRLLETTDLSIERVANEIGLRSASVFRERFRYIVGVSPQAYRRSFA